ncbi:MAG: DUF167 domain-containing protein [Streptomycetaceae bacterium]|nr:MAG: DUF167 domain-containing protein [Streptomycetaceae bacterium]
MKPSNSDLGTDRAVASMYASGMCWNKIAIVKVLAKVLDLRPRDFRIVHGELSRDKRTTINGNRTQIEDIYAKLSKLGNK